MQPLADGGGSCDGGVDRAAAAQRPGLMREWTDAAVRAWSWTRRAGRARRVDAAQPPRWRRAVPARRHRSGRRPAAGTAAEAAMIVRLLRRLWSLAWLLVLLAGVPAGLVRLVGWPLPDHWPTAGEWQVWLARPLTRTTLLDGAAIIGWLLWALLVYAVVVEVLTRARRVVRAAARLRLPTLPSPLQATASGMLGAAVFGMSTGSVHPPASPAAPPPATSLLPAAADAPVAVGELGGGTLPPVLASHPTVGERDPDLRGRGVALPDGGWITDQTAHAIAAAAAVVWWRRRHDYLPRPPTGADRDDADLAPLPPTVTTAQDVLHGRERPDDGPEDTGGAAHGGGAAVGRALAAPRLRAADHHRRRPGHAAGPGRGQPPRHPRAEDGGRPRRRDRPAGAAHPHPRPPDRPPPAGRGPPGAARRRVPAGGPGDPRPGRPCRRGAAGRPAAGHPPRDHRRAAGRLAARPDLVGRRGRPHPHPRHGRPSRRAAVRAHPDRRGRSAHPATPGPPPPAAPVPARAPAPGPAGTPGRRHPRFGRIAHTEAAHPAPARYGRPRRPGNGGGAAAAAPAGNTCPAPHRRRGCAGDYPAHRRAADPDLPGRAPPRRGQQPAH